MGPRRRPEQKPLRRVADADGHEEEDDPAFPRPGCAEAVTFAHTSVLAPPAAGSGLEGVGDAPMLSTHFHVSRSLGRVFVASHRLR